MNEMNHALRERVDNGNTNLQGAGRCCTTQRAVPGKALTEMTGALYKGKNMFMQHE